MTALKIILYINTVLFGWLFLSEIMASSKILKDEKTASKFSASNLEFTLTMYKQLAGIKKDENLFYSPFSISAALSMVYLGARTSTLKQMTKALVLQELRQDVHEAYETYIRDIMTGNENFTLNTANRLYPHQKAKLVRDYLNLCSKHYHADVTPLDFSQSEAARQNINNWVSQQTFGKIKDPIPSGILDDWTVLVLVNAIYFKGNWARQFRKSLTRQNIPFHTASGQKVRIDMMYQRENFRYMYNPEMLFATLELPYKGESLSMWIILPDAVDGLPALEEKITPDFLGIISEEMIHTEVEAYLPKFKLETEFELSDVLSSMGMPDAFDKRKADFTGIDESKLIYISKVFHKAFVEVNEEGTEAVAATGVKDVPTCASLPVDPKFVADHPFLFLIKDRRTDVILFAGRMVNPGVFHKAFVNVNEEGSEAAAATAPVMLLLLATFDPEFVADHQFLFLIKDRTDVLLFAGRLVNPGDSLGVNQQRDEL